MKRAVLAAALLLSAVLAGAAQPASARVRTPKQYTIEQFFATTGVRDASFSSDEKRILFSSNQTGVYNVYAMPVTGGTPSPQTASATDTTYAVSYFPNDDRVLYTRDEGGNELNHLYVRGRPRPVRRSSDEDDTPPVREDSRRGSARRQTDSDARRHPGARRIGREGV